MMTVLYVSILTTLVMTGVMIGLVKTYGEYWCLPSSIEDSHVLICVLGLNN